jgi:hypothetical protein
MMSFANSYPAMAPGSGAASAPATGLEKDYGTAVKAAVGWTKTLRIASGAAMLIISLCTNGSEQVSTEPDGQCAGLTAYMSADYATEAGFRRRCNLLREIEDGGNTVSPDLRDLLLHELSSEHAVELDFAGSVDLPAEAVDYLLENMPETAVLVSSYTDREYLASQVGAAPGPKSFFVTNSDTFAADFKYLYARESRDVSEYMFFESGHARVLVWRIWGNSFVRYKLYRNDDGTGRYEIKVHVFTDSRLLRTVLRSGLFRYFADRMFRGILEDIESAVESFVADSSPGEKLPPYFVSGLQAKLQ